MKARKIFGVIAILAILVALVPAMGVSAAAEKVAVCHLDDSGAYHLITISENAFPTHVAHGDASPSEWVPGQAGKKFAADCSIVSVDKRTLVDSVQVGAMGTVVSSNVTLESGVSYELEAIGTYRFVNWAAYPTTGIADARCSFRIPGSFNSTGSIAWIDGIDLLPGFANYLQIWLNGNPVEWGTACTADHIYTASFIGQGSQVSFKIVDNAYGDNSGNITVNIYKINW